MKKQLKASKLLSEKQIRNVETPSSQTKQHNRLNETLEIAIKKCSQVFH